MLTLEYMQRRGHDRYDQVAEYFTVQEKIPTIQIPHGVVKFTNSTSAPVPNCILYILDVQTPANKSAATTIESLKTPNLIVIVNKMDQVEWSEMAFNNVVNGLSAELRAAGIDAHVPFIPASALYGENLIERSLKCLWYSEKGGTIVDAIDKCVR